MKLAELWKQRTKSEKMMMLAIIPALLLTLTQFVFILPLDKETKQLNVQKVQTQQSIVSISAQIAELQIELEKRSLKKLNQQQKALSTALTQQGTKLSKLTASLIPPQLMAKIVEKMLKDRGKLILLSLESLPVEALVAQKKTKPAMSKKANNKKLKNIEFAQSNKALLYRHSLELKLRGRYFEVLGYLQNLENVGYKFYWDKLEYRVDKYPYAEIVINLSTLGTEPQWMGATDVE